MAGRFLIQKFSSQMCRSRSLFYAAARAGAPASEGSISALGNLSHGATPLVPNNAGIHGNLSHGATLLVPSNAGIHGSVGGFRTFSGIFPGAAGTVISNNRGVHGYAARSFNTLPCSRVATKTNCSTASMPSITINGLKPACVDSSGGAKGSFSSTASTREEISRSAKRAAWVAEWNAKSAAWQAQRAASQAEIERKIADFSKFLRIHVWLWGLAATCPLVGAFFEEENGTSLGLSKKENGTGFGNRENGSCCCNGECVSSKS